MVYSSVLHLPLSEMLDGMIQIVTKDSEVQQSHLYFCIYYFKHWIKISRGCTEP